MLLLLLLLLPPEVRPMRVKSQRPEHPASHGALATSKLQSPREGRQQLRGKRTRVHPCPSYLTLYSLSVFACVACFPVLLRTPQQHFQTNANHSKEKLQKKERTRTRTRTRTRKTQSSKAQKAQRALRALEERQAQVAGGAARVPGIHISAGLQSGSLVASK